MPKARLAIGLPGSGKSTFGQRNAKHHLIINRDAIRVMVYGGVYRFDFDYEASIKDMALSCAYAALNDGHNVYIDETNLTKAGRAFWVENLSRAGFETTYYLFPENTRNLEYRSLDMRGFTKEYWSDVIEKMRPNYVPPAEDGSEGNVGLVVVDNPYVEFLP